MKKISKKAPKREPVISQPLSRVDTQSESALPTGRIKVEGKLLFQEALVIVHTPSATRGVGIYYDWTPLPEEIMAMIRVKK